MHTSVNKRLKLKYSSIIAITTKQCNQIAQLLTVLVNKFDYKSSPKRLATFGLFRNRLIDAKTAVDIFRQLWKHLGNFLFQHLVTLITKLFCERTYFMDNAEFIGAQIEKVLRQSLKYRFRELGLFWLVPYFNFIYNSVDSSALSILRPWVRIPSTRSMLFL